MRENTIATWNVRTLSQQGMLECILGEASRLKMANWVWRTLERQTMVNI